MSVRGVDISAATRGEECRRALLCFFSFLTPSQWVMSHPPRTGRCSRKLRPLLLPPFPPFLLSFTPSRWAKTPYCTPPAADRRCLNTEHSANEPPLLFVASRPKPLWNDGAVIFRFATGTSAGPIASKSPVMTWWYELSVSVTYEDCGDEEIFAIKGGSLRRSLHDFAWCVRRAPVQQPFS